MHACRVTSASLRLSHKMPSGLRRCTLSLGRLADQKILSENVSLLGLREVGLLGFSVTISALLKTGTATRQLGRKSP